VESILLVEQPPIPWICGSSMLQHWISSPRISIFTSTRKCASGIDIKTNLCLYLSNGEMSEVREEFGLHMDLPEHPLLSIRDINSISK
jgi:hypothetical protein